MSDQEHDNFFDELIARSPRGAGAAFAGIGLALLVFVVVELSSGDAPNEFAVIIGPACLVIGLWLLIRGRCPQREQTIASVLGLAIGCLALYDLKKPASFLQQLF